MQISWRCGHCGPSGNSSDTGKHHPALNKSRHDGQVKDHCILVEFFLEIFHFFPYFKKSFIQKLLHFRSISVWNKITMDKSNEVFLASAVLLFLTPSMKKPLFNIKNTLLARNLSFEANIHLLNTCTHF